MQKAAPPNRDLFLWMKDLQPYLEKKEEMCNDLSERESEFQAEIIDLKLQLEKAKQDDIMHTKYYGYLGIYM